VALPYPLPEAWKLHDAQLVRRWPAVLWAVIAGGLAIAMTAANLRGDVAGGIIWAVLFGCVGAGLGVSYQRSGSEQGLPLLLNAVVLSRATVRPPDSWIHFFRETGPSRWMTACFALAGTISSTGLVCSSVSAVQAGVGLLLLLTIPLLFGALVLTLAGGIAIVQVVRHASFGRRPIGISLGRHGLIRYYLDDVDVWPWEAIAGIEATGKVVDKENGDFTANLVIVPTTMPADVSLTEYELWGYQSHAWLIYTAARFWAEHPELRSELGTTFGQQRIQAWRDEMAATTTAGSPRPS
jgi:hypothetical protein